MGRLIMSEGQADLISLDGAEVMIVSPSGFVVFWSPSRRWRPRLV